MLIARLHSKCFFVTGFFIGIWYGAWMRKRGYGDTLIRYYSDLCAYEIEKQFPDDKSIISLFKWAKTWVRTIKTLVPKEKHA